jgi:hypothetical protein
MEAAHYRLWNHKQNAHVCLVPILGITQGFLRLQAIITVHKTTIESQKTFR